MPLGIPLTQADVNNAGGDIARRINVAFDLVADFKAWLDQRSSAQLQADYGFTSTEADTLKSAFADLEQLRTIYEGTAALAVAKNFRTFTQRVWGLGF